MREYTQAIFATQSSDIVFVEVMFLQTIISMCENGNVLPVSHVFGVHGLSSFLQKACGFFSVFLSDLTLLQPSPYTFS